MGYPRLKLPCPKCGENNALVFEVDPGCAAVPCQDPDNPAYSDPGSGPEVRECLVDTCKCGHVADDDDYACADKILDGDTDLEEDEPPEPDIDDHP